MRWLKFSHRGAYEYVHQSMFHSTWHRPILLYNVLYRWLKIYTSEQSFILSKLILNFRIAYSCRSPCYRLALHQTFSELISYIWGDKYFKCNTDHENVNFQATPDVLQPELAPSFPRRHFQLANIYRIKRHPKQNQQIWSWVTQGRWGFCSIPFRWVTLVELFNDFD